MIDGLLSAWDTKLQNLRSHGLGRMARRCTHLLPSGKSAIEGGDLGGLSSPSPIHPNCPGSRMNLAVLVRFFGDSPDISSSSENESLSDREYQIMCLIASGKAAKEISRILSLSVKTVSTHRSRMLRKMNMKHNAQLIRYAIRNNLKPVGQILTIESSFL